MSKLLIAHTKSLKTSKYNPHFINLSKLLKFSKKSHCIYLDKYIDKRPKKVYLPNISVKSDSAKHYIDKFTIDWKLSIRNSYDYIPREPILYNTSMGNLTEYYTILELIKDKNCLDFLSEITGNYIDKIMFNTYIDNAPLCDAIAVVRDKNGGRDEKLSWKIEIKMTRDLHYSRTKAPCNPLALDVFDTEEHLIVICSNVKGSLVNNDFELTGKLLISQPLVDKHKIKESINDRNLVEFYGVPYNINGKQFY